MSIDSTKSLLATATSTSVTAQQQSSKAARSREIEPQAPAEKPVVAKAESNATAPTLEHVAARIDKYLKSVSRTLEFRVDAPGGHTVVSVRDTETGDVIRQFPNEEVLRLAEMAEDQTIVLVNEKV